MNYCKQNKMNRILKHIYIITNNFRAYATNKFSNNNCNAINSETIKQTDIKTEEEIQKMISVKMKEYHELVSSPSFECEEICSEMNKLEHKLRKSYGFSEDEDLTHFPVFKFNEVIIDNQLD